MTEVRRCFGGVGAVLFASALAVVAHSAPVLGQGTWETTLKGRDATGNAVPLLQGASPHPDLTYVYDTVLNLTWLAEWNANGAMDWGAANTWAAGLTDFGGGWSLPATSDTGSPGCDYSYVGTDCGYNVYGGEEQRRVAPMAHMYYDTLGNLAYCRPVDPPGTSCNDPQPGWGLVNTGPFHDMLPNAYWSTATVLAPGFTAWYFSQVNGSQWYLTTELPLYAVAVRPGDVLRDGTVPEPQSLMLTLTAMAGLGVALRRRRVA